MNAPDEVFTVSENGKVTGVYLTRGSAARAAVKAAGENYKPEFLSESARIWTWTDGGGRSFTVEAATFFPF